MKNWSYDPDRPECWSCKYWDDWQFGGICINEQSENYQEITEIHNKCDGWERICEEK